MRALYLDLAHPARVRLDGPSLLILRADRARTRHPLTRLARVVTTARVDWQTEALIACLERGVPVVFTGADGRLAGLCLGATLREPGLGEWLDDFCRRDDWRPRFEDWRLAAERRAIRSALAGLGLAATDLRPAALRNRLDAFLARPRAPAHARALRRRLEAPLAAQVAEALARRGVDPVMPGLARRGLCLPHVMRRIVAWRLVPLAASMLREGWVPSPGERCGAALVARYEREAPALERACRALIDDLWDWLRNTP